MEVRNKKSGVCGESMQFNPHSIGEIIVYYEDGKCSSEFIRDYEVYLDVGWKDMHEAFRDCDVIPNNYNTRFRRPLNETEREKGYYD